MSGADTMVVLREVENLSNSLPQEDRVVNSFRRLVQLMVSAKLGGQNWVGIATQTSSKLCDPANLISAQPKIASRLVQNPTAALESLKTAKWKTTEDSDEMHISTQDPLYNEFCETLHENPQDVKSLVLYFTAATSGSNHYHTLNSTMQQYVGQSRESFAKTVKAIQEFADEKTSENPNAFVESYSNILSSLDFDESKFSFHAQKNFPELPCFKPVAEKIPKASKMLAIQARIGKLNSLYPRVNPAKITVQNQQTLRELNEFFDKSKHSEFPSTDSIDAALIESQALYQTFKSSLFTTPEFHSHLMKQCTSISNQLINFQHNPSGLKTVNEEGLFAIPKRINPNLSTEELGSHLQELQQRLAKANAFKAAKII